MTAETKTDGRKSNGGARKGAGRPALAIGAKKRAVLLDPAREAKAKAAGRGNLAAGIRRAIDALRLKKGVDTPD